MSEDNDTQKNRRSIVTSLPSDYSDVQPKSYDPEFISAISNRMQVPDTIPVLNGDDTELTLLRNETWRMEADEGTYPRHMNVPERIILAGGGHHIGTKPEVAGLNFDDLPNPELVSLQTPPRTLTLEEQFPSIEREEEDENDNHSQHRVPNGTMQVRRSFSPGVNDSLSFTEEDATQLRTQMSRLHRRLATLERSQEVQANREKAIVGAAFGYFMLKFFFWFFRSK